MLLGINSSEKKSGFVCVGVTNLNSANPQHISLFRPAALLHKPRSLQQSNRAGSRFAQPALLPSEESCPHGVNHKAHRTPTTPRKRPGRADDYIKSAQTCQELLSVPNVGFFPSHLLDSSSFPSCSLTISIVLTFITLCQGQSASLSYSDIFSPLHLLYHRFLALSDSPQILQARTAVQQHICQGHVLPPSVTISLRGHQTLCIKHLFCTALQKGKETMWVETELNGVDDISHTVIYRLH